MDLFTICSFQKELLNKACCSLILPLHDIVWLLDITGLVILETMQDLYNYVISKGSMMYNRLIYVLSTYMKHSCSLDSYNPCAKFLTILVDHGVRIVFRYAWIDTNLDVYMIASSWFADKLLCVADGLNEMMQWQQCSTELCLFIDSVCLCFIYDGHCVERGNMCGCQICG